ncbi:unnamed protein product [Pseudo-nitzschia multistriata]|uniref:Uncharacterized protein n=1 Tax=Pseudo-nitzschia multistriata TaxID=183589 RepID=A0A448ZAV4_9STRA|nr:unnamed protein product [Pseudo-nitzschia multistriata]
MPRFVRIPVFDFVHDGPEEGPAVPPAVPSLEEFFAAYDVARCVWFRRRRTPLESKGGETGKRAGKRRRMDPAATIASSSSSPTTAATTAAATAEPKDAPARAPPWFLGPIREAYESASPLDKASWNVESGGGERRRKATEVSPSDLWGEASGNAYGYGYASFVLSEGATGPGLSEELAGLRGGGSHRLPHRLLWSNASPRGGAFPSVWVAPHCWVFCARNKGESEGSQAGSGPSRAVLAGRPEHTDAISHDGTVHWQLGGTKTWKLRPTLELMERTTGNHHRDRGGNGIGNGKDNGDEKNGDGIALSDSYTVCLKEGDFLVVDTRLWWHSTLIPPQLESSGFYSVSVARDLCLVDSGGSSPSRGSSNDRTQNQPFAPSHSEGCSVFNAEASWASGFLPSGSILLVDTVARATCGLEEPGGAFPEAYYDALPPTILRTGSGEEANCRLVVRWADEDSGDDDDDEDRGEPPPPSMVDVGLETMRDIREGDEFVVLQPP